MGSFNVACSVSNVSIAEGTKVVFFPLLPRRFQRAFAGQLEPKKFLTYQNDYYEPFCLPIEGVYNDYGSIEHIVETDNTRAIEQFFGVSIQVFVENIGDTCIINDANERAAEVYENLSGMFVHKDVYDALVGYDLQDNSLADGYLTQDIAEFYDFRVVPRDEQLSIDPHHSILMRKEGFPYDLKVGEYGAVLVHQDLKEYYVFGFSPSKRDIDDIWRHWEEATGTKAEETFPVHPQSVTKEGYEQIKQVFARLTGSQLGWVANGTNKHSIYSVKQFANAMEQLTGEVLDITMWEAISQYDADFAAFQRGLMAYKPEKRNYQAMLETTTDETQRKLIQSILAFEKENPNDNDFGYELSKSDFMRFFSNMDFFKTLYTPYLLGGSLRNAFKEYQAFYHSMHACNRFFFPALNGEQCGNAEASKMLLDASIDIVKKQLQTEEE